MNGMAKIAVGCVAAVAVASCTTPGPAQVNDAAPARKPAPTVTVTLAPKPAQSSPAPGPTRSATAAPAEPAPECRGGVCRSLRLGSRGEDVTALLRALNTVMGFGLVVDGYFGPQTEAAVRAFQVRYGQVVDGVYGPQSAAAMSAIFAGRLLPVD